MQEIANEFGIQPILLLAQIVNFLLVLYLLKRFALKPILKVLKDRQATVAESIKNAQDAQIALEKATEKEKEILQKAQTQAQATIEEAKTRATEIVTESEAATREKVDHMIADASKKIEKQTEDAEHQLATKVTTLAADMLKKTLTGMLDEKEQEKVVEKATKTLKK